MLLSVVRYHDATLAGLDLFVFHRKVHMVRTREAIAWSIVWVAVALAFNAVVYWQFGSERGRESVGLQSRCVAALRCRLPGHCETQITFLVMNWSLHFSTT
jgi:hypothetical protein